MARTRQPASVLRVRVQPGASRSQVLGYDGQLLRVRVSAPPEDGRANEAVVALLAEALGVPRSRVRILRGHTSRDKLVSMESLSLEEVVRRLTTG